MDGVFGTSFETLRTMDDTFERLPGAPHFILIQTLMRCSLKISPVIMRCSQILAMPSIPDPRMVADLGNTVDFLHRVRALKVRGAKGYVGTSNIVWNSLSYSLHICKNLLALWISDSDATKVRGLSSAKRTLRRLVVHYSMNSIEVSVVLVRNKLERATETIEVCSGIPFFFEVGTGEVLSCVEI
ncbi:unnamed protein product [Heligmosomoides polygyrus]|uniref:SLC12 domain-containing protein n=1 Tax=Heligmosomoides polygyrus TaxID=6339 RepID=A0A183F5E3_HELPZ|nr:unnamed protein product [Heligmosomoides polygyrus]